jgi:hypothetical protein
MDNPHPVRELVAKAKEVYNFYGGTETYVTAIVLLFLLVGSAVGPG